jgi:phytanoyl-CoA hydroxylase
VLGKQTEADFTAKAKAANMTEEEARNAFNANMMAGGVLSPNPKQFAREHNVRWLVTGYEAGDVVLHNSYAVYAIPRLLRMIDVLTKDF